MSVLDLVRQSNCVIRKLADDESLEYKVKAYPDTNTAAIIFSVKEDTSQDDIDDIMQKVCNREAVKPKSKKKTVAQRQKACLEKKSDTHTWINDKCVKKARAERASKGTTKTKLSPADREKDCKDNKSKTHTWKNGKCMRNPGTRSYTEVQLRDRENKCKEMGRFWTGTTCRTSAPKYVERLQKLKRSKANCEKKKGTFKRVDGPKGRFVCVMKPDKETRKFSTTNYMTDFLSDKVAHDKLMGRLKIDNPAGYVNAHNWDAAAAAKVAARYEKLVKKRPRKPKDDAQEQDELVVLDDSEVGSE